MSEGYYLYEFNEHVKTSIDHIIKKYPNLKEMNNSVYYDFCKFFWESHVEFKYINIKELNNLSI